MAKDTEATTIDTTRLTFSRSGANARGDRRDLLDKMQGLSGLRYVKPFFPESDTGPKITVQVFTPKPHNTSDGG